jgi:hypothetical protein
MENGKWKGGFGLLDRFYAVYVSRAVNLLFDFDLMCR